MDEENKVYLGLEAEIEIARDDLSNLTVGTDEYIAAAKHLDNLYSQWNSYNKIMVEYWKNEAEAEAEIRKQKLDENNAAGTQKTEKIKTIVENSVNGAKIFVSLLLTVSLIGATVAIEKEGTCRSKVWSLIPKLF